MESWCDACPFRGRACKGSLLPEHCPAISGGEPGGRTAPAVAPTILRKAANFGKALVMHAVAGFPGADDVTVKSRLATCLSCELYSPAGGRCLHRDCGCVLEIKVTWADQKCPTGKW